jgi:hypothetical protein
MRCVWIQPELCGTVHSGSVFEHTDVSLACFKWPINTVKSDAGIRDPGYIPSCQIRVPVIGTKLKLNANLAVTQAYLQAEQRKQIYSDLNTKHLSDIACLSHNGLGWSQ